MPLPRKSMTLNLSEQELAILRRLCEKKELTKTAVVRQALRLYELIDDRLDQNEKLFFVHQKTGEKTDLVLL